jgi:tRNA nucleotidyltransferase/poly(A) polymerase
MQIEKDTVLKDALFARVFGSGADIYLVGGCVRDILRGVRSRDFDFVVRGDPADFVSRIFGEREGRVVTFRETLLVRVIAGDTVADFSELKGEIEEDLVLRDFTVNALAWSPGRGLVDPLGGKNDIAKGRLRGIAERNFREDPLRLLRAYRFSAELGWAIDRRTRETVRKLKQSISSSATERITLELFRLLNAGCPLRALKQAFADGLVGEIIALKAGGLEDNIKALSRLERFLKKIPEELRSGLAQPVSQGLQLIGLLRAEHLLYGADLAASRLSLSRALQKRVVAAAKLLEQYEEGRTLDDATLFDLLTGADEAVLDFGFLTGRLRYLRKAERFLRIPRVASTDEIMKIAGLSPGPDVGLILREMKKLQFLGTIIDHTDALTWLRTKKI